jgi:hypothetical protein
MIYLVCITLVNDATNWKGCQSTILNAIFGGLLQVTKYMFDNIPMS